MAYLMPAQKCHFDAGKIRNLHLGFHHGLEENTFWQKEDRKSTHAKIRMIQCLRHIKLNSRMLHNHTVHPIIALHHERVAEVQIGENVARERSAPEVMAYI